MQYILNLQQNSCVLLIFRNETFMLHTTPGHHKTADVAIKKMFMCQEATAL
jgi:hypothetical protein